MNNRAVGRPEPDEIPSHYVGYIKRVPELDPVIVCADQIEETTALLRGLSDTDAMYRYERGKWSIKEVVGHLADVERIMAYRALGYMIPGHERHHVEILRTRYGVSGS